MSTSLAPKAPSTERFFGLRRQPGRVAIAVFRLPLVLYHHGWGWLLGRTFLLLTHIGRRTGQPHDAVAMVLSYDPATRESVICSGWGPDVDWVRNLHAHPAARITIGRDSYTPEHRFLTDEEAFAVAVRFRGAHRRRMRLISTILGWGDLRHDDAVREFIRTRPFVAFRPTS